MVQNVNRETKESQIAGLDNVTFFGLVCILAGIPGMACITLVGSVPYDLLSFLAVFGAAVSVLGNAIVRKGMGYRAAFSTIKQNYAIWLYSVALILAGAVLTLGIISVLRRITS